MTRESDISELLLHPTLHPVGRKGHHCQSTTWTLDPGSTPICLTWLVILTLVSAVVYMLELSSVQALSDPLDIYSHYLASPDSCRLATLGFPGHLTLYWLPPLTSSQRGLQCHIRPSDCSQILHHCMSQTLIWPGGLHWSLIQLIQIPDCVVSGFGAWDLCCGGSSPSSSSKSGSSHHARCFSCRSY